jgi:hypothetical protein
MPTCWAELAARFNLQIVYAFGSRAKEVAAWSVPQWPLPVSDSDVDIGVKPVLGAAWNLWKKLTSPSVSKTL